MPLKAKFSENRTFVQAAGPKPSVQISSAETMQRFFDDDLAAAYPVNIAEQGQQYVGVIYGGSNWCDFFLRLRETNDEVLSAIHSDMNHFYGREGIPPLKSLGLWAPGMPCAVRYTRDRKWYRARLEDTSYGLVRFVDYGNVQMCQEDDVKPLLRAVADIAPPACIRCTLTESQHTTVIAYDRSSNRVTATVLAAGEPYEVAIENSTANHPEMPDAIEMVTDNLLNEFREERKCTQGAANGMLLDLMDDIVQTETCTSAFELVPLTPIVVGSAEAGHDKEMSTTRTPAADHAAIDSSMCEWHQLLDGQTSEQQVYDLAVEEAKKLRREEKELVAVMKMVMKLDEDRCKLFFGLLDCA